MPNSIWSKISNPRETYTDGYGTQREVYEPGYITTGRKIYNAVDRFMNGPETVTIGGVETRPVGSSGALGMIANPVGAADDVAQLAKHLESVKSALRNTGGLYKGLYGFTKEGKWVPLTRRAADLRAGDPSKYAFYASIDNAHMPAKVAAWSKNLVEKGTLPSGEAFVIRRNAYADDASLFLKKWWNSERYSGPDEWAMSGSGSSVVRGR